MWEFTSLADQAHDIKVIYSGNVWWHKGMTKHSVDTIFYVTPTPRTDQFLRNAGFERAVASGPWTVTNVQQTVFDSWQAQNGAGSSAVLSRELTIKSSDSDASAKIVQTRVAGSLTLFQRMPIPAVFRGKQIAVSFQVRQGVGASTRAYIADNVATTFGATSATTGSFVTLTATRTIDAAATFVEVGVSVDVSDTVYVDNSIVNLGSVASAYQPEYWYAGAASDDIIGSRTPDQAVAAATGAWGLGTLLSMIANRIKAIMGTTNWYDAPADTVASLNSRTTTAQSTANTAVTNAATAQSTANSKIDQTTADGRYMRLDIDIDTHVSHFNVATGTLQQGGQPVWHAGNFAPATKSDTTHNHNGTYFKLDGTAETVSAVKTLTVTGGSVRFGNSGDGTTFLVSGNFASTGGKSAIVRGPDNKYHSFAATESPHMMFEDYGTALLENGFAFVEIPEDFRYYVDTALDYFVWLTPHGKTGGLYISEYARDYFIVESEDPGSVASFDWRISALRKDVNQERMAIMGGQSGPS